MTVLDVLTSPWAIQPAKLLEIQGIYFAHARGEKADLAAIEQRIGKPLANEPKRYDVVDGVAVLPIEGVIAKRMNLFSAISGGTSSELAAAALREALDDPAVHSIVLSIDSPGGTVDGTQALASQVLAARDSGKPIVTLASGTMASAAYWIGSAAQAAYIADGTTQVGSIGVVATHTDVSGAEAQRGIKTTEVAAGKYKRIASQHAPLTEDGRKVIQEQVDYTYSIFVDAVATHRGVTVEKVLADMADGRVFIGQQAVAAGLVDGITTLSALVSDLNQRRAAPIPQGKGACTMPITREQLAAEAPDLVAALQAEAAAAERERIQAVEGALIPGHEALIAMLKFDGKSTGGDAALAVNAAERALRQRAAAAHAADAPQPLPSAAAPAGPAPDPADDMSLPVEARCKAAWDKSADLQREFSSLGAYTAYVRNTEKGVARIMSKKQGA